MRDTHCRRWQFYPCRTFGHLGRCHPVDRHDIRSPCADHPRHRARAISCASPDNRSASRHPDPSAPRHRHPARTGVHVGDDPHTLFAQDLLRAKEHCASRRLKDQRPEYRRHCLDGSPLPSRRRSGWCTPPLERPKAPLAISHGAILPVRPGMTICPRGPPDGRLRTIHCKKKRAGC